MTTETIRAEFCSVAYDNDCLNPCGFRVGGRVGGNSDGPRIKARCSYCGDAVCANCRTGKRGSWRCKYHDESETVMYQPVRFVSEQVVAETLSHGSVVITRPGSGFVTIPEDTVEGLAEWLLSLVRRPEL